MNRHYLTVNRVSTNSACIVRITWIIKQKMPFQNEKELKGVLFLCISYFPPTPNLFNFNFWKLFIASISFAKEIKVVLSSPLPGFDKCFEI